VISTSLVLVPLIFSSSYIFQVFGKCIISIMVLSAWHGLAVLPVLLSFVQPASYADIRDRLDGDGGSKAVRGDKMTVFPEPDDTDANLASNEVSTAPKRITAI